MLDGFKELTGRKGEVVLVSDDTFDIIGPDITPSGITRDLARCGGGGHLGLFVELTLHADEMEQDAWAEYVAALVSFRNGISVSAVDLLAELAGEYDDAPAVVAPASTWCSTCASVAGACRH